jgi:hypothetical protein
MQERQTFILELHFKSSRLFLKSSSSKLQQAWHNIFLFHSILIQKDSNERENIGSAWNWQEVYSISQDYSLSQFKLECLLKERVNWERNNLMDCKDNAFMSLAWGPKHFPFTIGLEAAIRTDAQPTDERESSWVGQLWKRILLFVITWTENQASDSSVYKLLESHACFSIHDDSTNEETVNCQRHEDPSNLNIKTSLSRFKFELWTVKGRRFYVWRW